MGELGRSLREHNRGITQAVTAVMRVQLEERKWELRKEKQRPRGGIREQALTDVASRHGMTVEAFKKRLERIKPTRNRDTFEKVSVIASSEIADSPTIAATSRGISERTNGD